MLNMTFKVTIIDLRLYQHMPGFFPFDYSSPYLGKIVNFKSFFNSEWENNITLNLVACDIILN